MTERVGPTGRGRERAVLDAAVADGGSVVVAGPAGVGKSHLVAGWLAGRAPDGRAHVVVRATRSTSTIPFGAFAPWAPDPAPADRLGLLRALATRLTGRAGGDPGTGGGPGTGGDPGTGGGEREAPIVVVDDAHLLDDGSAALALYLAEHTAASVVATVRTGEPCPDAVEAIAAAGGTAGGATGTARGATGTAGGRVVLGSLARAGADALVEHLLAGPVEPATRGRLWDLTGGNPLYLVEVVAAARAQGVLALARTSARGRAASGGSRAWRWSGELAGSDRLDALVADRVGDRDTPERRVLELVALGEPLPLDTLAALAPPALLAGLEERGLLVVDTPAGSASGAGIGGADATVTTTATPGASAIVAAPATPAARIGHPLYAEALRAQLPSFAAPARHRELAVAALATGADRREPLRVATWALHGDLAVPHAGDEDGDPRHAVRRAASVLERGALLAAATDDHALAARLAEAATRAGAGWRAVLVRAEALGVLGHGDEADALLADLARPGAEPAARAAAACVRADTLAWRRTGRLGDARRLLAEAAAGLPAPERASVHACAARLALADLDLPATLALATQATSDADTVAGRLHGVATAALAAAMAGRAELALHVASLAVPYAVATIEEDPVPAGILLGCQATALPAVGRNDAAVATFAALREAPPTRLGGPARVLPTMWLAAAETRRGRIADAVELAREAMALVPEGDRFGYGTWAAALLATAVGQSGDAAGAQDALAAVRAGPGGPNPGDVIVVGLAEAWALAAGGELSAARAVALDVAGRVAKAEAWAVEVAALIDVVRLDGAALAAPRLAELAGLADGVLTAVAAHFARAAADRDGAALDGVVAEAESIGTWLLAAEAAALAAEAHGAARRPRARAASLATAHRLLDRCPGAATPLLAHLDRDPRAGALTGREAEVAGLVAHGLASRDVARALGISVRTVDSHLGHAYVKLGITDRADLPAALGLGAGPVTGGPRPSAPGRPRPPAPRTSSATTRS